MLVYQLINGRGPRAGDGEPERVAAGFDEGLLPLTLSNLLYMKNPHSYRRCQ